MQHSNDIRSRNDGRLRPETPEARRAAFLAKTAVPWPFGAEDEYLFFQCSDLIELEKEHGTNYFQIVERAVLSGSGKVIVDCIQLALKRQVEATKFVRIDFDQADISYPLHDSAKPILNALCLAIIGQSHDDLTAEKDAA